LSVNWRWTQKGPSGEVWAEPVMSSTLMGAKLRAANRVRKILKANQSRIRVTAIKER